MQIFLRLKDKLNNFSRIYFNEYKQEGFTILECVLAIGILSIVVSSIVGLQSSVISITQVASNRMRADWALRSAVSQVLYLADTKGQASIPENSSFQWKTDPGFALNVTRKELKQLKTSHFLISAMAISNLTSGSENVDTARQIAPIASFLDNVPGANPKGNFSNVIITVTWTEGTVKQSLSKGFFYLDKAALSGINIPGTGSNANPNGDGTGGDSNTGTAGNGNGNPPVGGGQKQ